MKQQIKLALVIGIATSFGSFVVGIFFGAIPVRPNPFDFLLAPGWDLMQYLWGNVHGDFFTLLLPALIINTALYSIIPFVVIGCVRHYYSKGEIEPLKINRP